MDECPKTAKKPKWCESECVCLKKNCIFMLMDFANGQRPKSTPDFYMYRKKMNNKTNPFQHFQNHNLNFFFGFKCHNIPHNHT